jgi:importin subunit beta-1
VQKTALTVLQRMEQLLGIQNQIVGVDDRNNWNELQSNLCGVIIVRLKRYILSLPSNLTISISQCVIRKLNEGIQPLADRIMTLVIQLIQSAGRTSTVLEDAFLVVGAMAPGTVPFWFCDHV